MDDLTAMAAMLQASEMADHGRVTTTEHDLRVRWEMPGYDLARDAWLIVAPDGQLAAMISMAHRHAERMSASPRVHPNYTALSLYDALIELGVERARELVVEAQDGARVTLHVFCAEKNVEFHRALERAGFKHVRSDWTMQIDMDAPPPKPSWPEEIELRSYTPEMLYAVYEADNEAFRDHWGHLPVKFHVWQNWTIRREGFDPSLWLLACEGDEIAAFALCECEQGEGWIGELGVRRPWRRKGLGLALLYQAFGEFYRRGISRVSLNVDSQNLTGATRLYRRAGMRPVEQSDMYELELRAGVELSTATLAV